MHRNATLGKLHYMRGSMTFTNTVFNITFFSNNHVHMFSNLASSRNWCNKT